MESSRTGLAASGVESDVRIADTSKGECPLLGLVHAVFIVVYAPSVQVQAGPRPTTAVAETGCRVRNQRHCKRSSGGRGWWLCCARLDMPVSVLPLYRSISSLSSLSSSRPRSCCFVREQVEQRTSIVARNQQQPSQLQQHGHRGHANTKKPNDSAESSAGPVLASASLRASGLMRRPRVSGQRSTQAGRELHLHRVPAIPACRSQLDPALYVEDRPLSQLGHRALLHHRCAIVAKPGGGSLKGGALLGEKHLQHHQVAPSGGRPGEESQTAMRGWARWTMSS